MEQSFITQYFEAARATSTPVALEAALNAAHSDLSKAEYNLLLAWLIVAARLPRVEGEPTTRWQYPILVGQLRSAGARDTDSAPAGADGA